MNNATMTECLVPIFSMLPEASFLSRLSDRLKAAGREAANLWTMAAIAGVCVELVPAPCKPD
ncbi:MAG TPA: hypothetical protein VNM24_07895 [Burkholderiales bacterium]|jgi:hypothetical protein|nr:hypothetical protein [Burkholderiales bacterium]